MSLLRAFAKTSRSSDLKCFLDSKMVTNNPRIQAMSLLQSLLNNEWNVVFQALKKFPIEVRLIRFDFFLNMHCLDIAMALDHKTKCFPFVEIMREDVSKNEIQIADNRLIKWADFYLKIDWILQCDFSSEFDKIWKRHWSRILFGRIEGQDYKNVEILLEVGVGNLEYDIYDWEFSDSSLVIALTNRQRPCDSIIGHLLRSHCDRCDPSHIHKPWRKVLYCCSLEHLVYFLTKINTKQLILSEIVREINDSCKRFDDFLKMFFLLDCCFKSKVFEKNLMLIAFRVQAEIITNLWTLDSDYLSPNIFISDEMVVETCKWIGTKSEKSSKVLVNALGASKSSFKYLKGTNGSNSDGAYDNDNYSITDAMSYYSAYSYA
eukprot:TRINITY_DN793_c0_g1_i3.p1 TRINITY_DN793_c0_g1~~TRINITY_DN793_c0_g1_i3.p1  ORF type:complete len:376 (+),score=57.50 TRINITY_DN793_c0_g1_i3:141-1268(+)